MIKMGEYCHKKILKLSEILLFLVVLSQLGKKSKNCNKIYHTLNFEALFKNESPHIDLLLDTI